MNQPLYRCTACGMTWSKAELEAADMDTEPLDNPPSYSGDIPTCLRKNCKGELETTTFTIVTTYRCTCGKAFDYEGAQLTHTCAKRKKEAR